MGGSIQTDPGQRRLYVNRIERWYADRQRGLKTDLAPWELDRAFVHLAVALWPLDMESATTQRFEQSARQRLRLRWEGFRAVVDARAKVQVLHDVALLVLRELDGERTGLLAELTANEFDAITWWFDHESEMDVPERTQSILHEGGLLGFYEDDTIALTNRGDLALAQLRETRNQS